MILVDDDPARVLARMQAWTVAIVSEWIDRKAGRRCFCANGRISDFDATPALLGLE